MKIGMRKGITLIELIIAMTVLSIIGIAIVGLSSSIVRSYSNVSYRTTARDMATITMQSIRNQIVTAESANISTTLSTGLGDNTYQIYVDSGSVLKRKKGTSEVSTIMNTFGNEMGSGSWTMDVVFNQINDPVQPIPAPAEPITSASVEIEVTVYDPGGKSHSFITQVFLPNVEINLSNNNVGGESSGAYLEYRPKTF